MKILVMTKAVNMDRITPSASVMANPLTVPEPKIPRTAAAISVVIFPSRIADSALWNPVSMAVATVPPSAISSWILAKMMTLASTAIPMERMMPAIPGSVRVMS